MKRVQCFYCDGYFNSDDMGALLNMCKKCEQEFNEVQRREKYVCARGEGKCKTPVTCATHAMCVSARTKMEVKK